MKVKYEKNDYASSLQREIYYKLMAMEKNANNYRLDNNKKKYEENEKNIKLLNKANKSLFNMYYTNIDINTLSNLEIKYIKKVINIINDQERINLLNAINKDIFNNNVNKKEFITKKIEEIRECLNILGWKNKEIELINSEEENKYNYKTITLELLLNQMSNEQLKLYRNSIPYYNFNSNEVSLHANYVLVNKLEEFINKGIFEKINNFEIIKEALLNYDDTLIGIKRIKQLKFFLSFSKLNLNNTKEYVNTLLEKYNNDYNKYKGILSHFNKGYYGNKIKDILEEEKEIKEKEISNYYVENMDNVVVLDEYIYYPEYLEFKKSGFDGKYIDYVKTRYPSKMDLICYLEQKENQMIRKRVK